MTVRPSLTRLIRVLLPACILAFAAQAQEWELRVCAEPNSLPYSNREGEGFENLIAEVVAREMKAQPVFVWLPRRAALVQNVLLREGRCDLVMGVNDGHADFLTSLAYYRSSYVFVYRKDRPFSIESMDDPVLRELRIGVQVAGSGVSAPTLALANRGLLDRQVGLTPDRDDADPLSRLIAAVVADEVDVAIVWGPVAGFFAQGQQVALELVAVTPEIEPPFVPMVSSIAMGVRPGDEALRDRLNQALRAAWEEIESILREFGVPLMPLPVPTARGG